MVGAMMMPRLMLMLGLTEMPGPESENTQERVPASSAGEATLSLPTAAWERQSMSAGEKNKNDFCC